MRRRSQRSRYTWMPLLGTTSSDGESTYQTNVVRLSLRPNNDQGTPPSLDDGSGLGAAVITALVPDYTEEPDPAHGTSMTLRDYTEGQDWFLRRLVGKLVVAAAATNNTRGQDLDWPAVLVTAGFFVARSQDSAEGEIDLAVNEWDPQDLRNIRQPWIWRRTWVLGCAEVPAATVDPTRPVFSDLFPNSNVEYGSMAEGSHVDAKTMRRILREERLWFAMSVQGQSFTGVTNVTGGVENAPVVQAWLDVRALGAMRKSRNKSHF